MDALDIDALITHVRIEASTDEPLDQLTTARQLRDGLAETAEALLDHFVDQARRAGCSWTQIGDALGVSKQAAQQRASAPTTLVRGLMGRLRSAWSAAPGRGPFGRTSEEAREVILRARAAALELEHPQIGTGHLLLGLAGAGDGVVGDTLQAAGVHEARVRAGLRSREVPASPLGRVEFSSDAAKVMESALRESLRLGSDEIGPEHVLLGLLREQRNTAGEILGRLDADRRRMRTSVEERIARIG